LDHGPSYKAECADSIAEFDSCSDAAGKEAQGLPFAGFNVSNFSDPSLNLPLM
jgi:hypothetical protein